MAEAGYTEIQLLGRTSTPTTIAKGSSPSLNCWLPSVRFRASAGFALLPRIHVTSRTISWKRSMLCLRCATTFICRCRVDRPMCWASCSGNTPASSICSASHGSGPRAGRSVLRATSSSAFQGGLERDFGDHEFAVRSRIRCRLRLQDCSPRPNTPAISLADSIPEEEKSRRLQILMDHQREIQRARYSSTWGDS